MYPSKTITIETLPTSTREMIEVFGALEMVNEKTSLRDYDANWNGRGNTNKTKSFELKIKNIEVLIICEIACSFDEDFGHGYTLYIHDGIAQDATNLVNTITKLANGGL